MDAQLLQQQSVVVMDDLVEEVCWQLLGAVEIARVAFMRDEEPWILPVTVRLLGKAVVFRTAVGSMLDELDDDTPVVVEVDHTDSERRTGWSVLVRGTIEHVPPDAIPAVDGCVHPWAPDDKDRWMWVIGTEISGRSISRQGPPPKFRLPYMPLD